MTGHIADRAPGLAALPQGDPDRTAAYEHAAACRDCAKALDEAERLLVLLDEAPAPPPPSDAVMRRALDAVVSEMRAAERGADRKADREQTWFPGWRAMIAVAASLLLLLVDARSGELAFAVGVECLLIELGTAAAAVGVAALVLENRSGRSRAATFGALAAWGAVVAQIYLHFRCPAAHGLPHLVAFHFLGVLLAAFFGGPFGARLERRPA